jgi:hypothetical protein
VTRSGMPKKKRKTKERGGYGGWPKEGQGKGSTERVDVAVYNGHSGDLDGGRR